MKTLRYIHAADLQLDRPFTGLNHGMVQGDGLTQTLHNASFQALERLERFCLDEKPDFLLLTGNLSRSSEKSLRAEKALTSFCSVLGEAGIQVFIVRGLEDPLETNFTSFAWPDNVHFFGSSCQKVLYSKDGEPCALVHGVSCKTTKDATPVPDAFVRDIHHDDCFQLALLVTDKENMSTESLSKGKLDAWALGGIKNPLLLSETAPCITCAGSLQGLSFSEDGEHGCFLVEAKKENDTWQTSTSFHSLAPVIWRTLTLDVSGRSDCEEVRVAIEEALENEQKALPARCQTLVTRIMLTGDFPSPTALAAQKADLCASFAYLRTEQPETLLAGITLAIDSSTQNALYGQRDDLLGETVRLAAKLTSDSDMGRQFLHSAISPLYGLGQFRSILSMPEGKSLTELLRDAEQHCIASMEIDNNVH